jgi:acyl dehydratase
MRFEQFTSGQQISAGPVTLSAAEIVEFARAWDPQWFHTDAERAANSRWRGLIASGWQTCAIAMRLAVQTALVDSESFGSPGLDYVKWPTPVRPGDTLMLRADVIEARRSQRQPTLGILKWRWRLFNQDEVVVLDLVATSLFELDTTP